MAADAAEGQMRRAADAVRRVSRQGDRADERRTAAVRGVRRLRHCPLLRGIAGPARATASARPTGAGRRVTLPRFLEVGIIHRHGPFPGPVAARRLAAKEPRMPRTSIPPLKSMAELLDELGGIDPRRVPLNPPPG